MFTFVQQNLIYILCAFALGVSFMLFFFLRKKITYKPLDCKNTVFSNKEYEKYLEDGEKVLNNTTITFKQVASETPSDDLYIKTFLAGASLMKDKSFSISKVGDI